MIFPAAVSLPGFFLHMDIFACIALGRSDANDMRME